MGDRRVIRSRCSCSSERSVSCSCCSRCSCSSERSPPSSLNFVCVWHLVLDIHVCDRFNSIPQHIGHSSTAGDFQLLDVSKYSVGITQRSEQRKVAVVNVLYKIVAKCCRRSLYFCPRSSILGTKLVSFFL